jgi:tetratricopeptide (TPR) repeat protein
MATKKRKVVKKDIKKDPLVTYALKVSNYTQEHFNQVIIGVVVLIALISIVVFTTNSRRSSSVQSERQLAQALSLYQARDFEAAKVTFAQINNRFGGRNGAIAQYYKAECELSQRNYSQALMDYEAYLDGSSDFPEFKAAAMFGSALCHEGLENYTLAAKAMEQVHHAVDESDPRYLDSAFKAGELFARIGDTERASHFFQLVADNASGNLKDRASVAVTLLNAR